MTSKRNSFISISAPAGLSKTIAFSGVSLTESSWIKRLHPFIAAPNCEFQAREKTAFSSFLYTKEEEQLEESGSRAASWSDSISSLVRDTYIASTSKLVCSLGAKRGFGVWRYNLKDLELDKGAEIFLNPRGKTAAEYKKSIKKFVDRYGYYVVNEYEVEASIFAVWQIETAKISSKEKISRRLKSFFSKKDFSFHSLKRIINEETAAAGRAFERVKIYSFGLDVTPISPARCDDIIQDWDRYSTAKTAAIKRVGLSTWDTIPAIAMLLEKAPKTPEFKKALATLYEGAVSEEIFNEAGSLYSRFKTLKKLLKNAHTKPFSNAFWGFFVPKKELPLDSIRLLEKAAATGISKIAEIPAKNFERLFSKLSKDLEKGYKKILKDFKTLTQLNDFEFQIGVSTFEETEKRALNKIFSSLDCDKMSVKGGPFVLSAKRYNFKDYAGFDYKNRRAIFEIPYESLPENLRENGLVIFKLYAAFYPRIRYTSIGPSFSIWADMSQWNNWNNRVWTGIASIDSKGTTKASERSKQTGRTFFFKTNENVWIGALWRIVWFPEKYEYKPIW